MATWITTPLTTGPIPADNYNCTISGLSGNTAYEYRAYMVVDGIPYCGDILTINTAAAPSACPSVSTGIAANVSCYSMDINGNSVTNKGIPEPLIEYGILYTQNPSYGTASTLKYESVGASVKKSSVLSGGTTVPFTFNENTSLLLQNTMTYYRAFGRNATGVGYGNVELEQTLAPSQSLVYLHGTELRMDDQCVCACAKIGVDPPLGSGDGFRLCFTNSACSVSDGGTRQMRMCARIMQGLSIQPASNAMSVLPDNPNGHAEDIVELTGYVDITSSNINNFTFITEGCSHAINIDAINTNCAVVQLGAIVNQTGGSYELADHTSTYMKVYTASLNCQPSGGHIPQIV